MKTKDVNWYLDKIQDIKKRKRKLKYMNDPEAVKKTKRDLKREQRAAKRTERNCLNIYIKEEVDKFYGFE